VAAYFVVAVWLDRTYVDLRPTARIAVQLIPPFDRINHAAIVRHDLTRSLDDIADDETIEGDSRSPVVIYENGTPLGPAHSGFRDISQLGAGRFAHWQSSGIVFSASDNSDPNTNGRNYWAVVPDTYSKPKAKVVVQLFPPFDRVNRAAFVRRELTRRLDDIADDETIEGDSRSPVVIYENGTQLGPAHSGFRDISQLGEGRFAHWQSTGIVFSASDNSDPNTNGRNYWAVVPDTYSKPKGRIVVQLFPPFDRVNRAAIVRRELTRRLDDMADDETIEDDSRSPVVIYENGTRLGPAHSSFKDIDQLGEGRFAHWRSSGIVFSASDNSDPNTNGRIYWAVVPE
jgi:hypothetical protein